MGSLESENRDKRELDDDENFIDDTPPPKRLAQSSSEDRQSVSLLDLSDDVLLMILKHCTPIELKAVGFTCERLGYLIRDHTLWHRVDARDVPYGRKRFYWLLNVALTASTRELKLAGFAREPIGFSDSADRTVDDEEEDDSIYEEENTSKSTQTSDSDFEPFSNKPLTRPKSVPKNISSPGSSLEEAGSSTVDPARMDETNPCQHPIFTFTRDMLCQLSAQCKNLTSLFLEYCNINNIHTDLGCFPRTLKSLSLKGTRIYNVPFEKSFLYKAVDYLDELEYLDVSECNWMEGHVLLSISKMSKLKTLIMKNCFRMYEFVAYASLAGRYGFRKLQVLDVRGSPFCDSELTALGWLPELQELYMAPHAPRSTAFADKNTPDHFPWEVEVPEYFRLKSYGLSKKGETKGDTPEGQDESSTKGKGKSNKDDDKKKQCNKTVTYFWKLFYDGIAANAAAMDRLDRQREMFGQLALLRAHGLPDLRRADGQQDGRHVDGQQDGRGAVGQQDGRGAVGQQDGSRTDGQQGGGKAVGQQDGNRNDGQQGGGKAVGQQDGNRNDGQQGGGKAVGQQDGNRNDGQQGGEKAVGQQDGGPDDGIQDVRRADGLQDDTVAVGQQDGRRTDSQKDDKLANGSQEGLRVDGQEEVKHVDSQEGGDQISPQQNGGQNCSCQDGEQVDRSKDDKEADRQGSDVEMVHQKNDNHNDNHEDEVCSQQNDRHVIDESDDKRTDHKHNVINLNNETDECNQTGDHRNGANPHQPQPGSSQSNDPNLPGPSKVEDENALKGSSKRKMGNAPKEVKFKRQCPNGQAPSRSNGQGNFVHIFQGAVPLDHLGNPGNLGPRNNNLPRNRVFYVNFGRQIPSMVYRMAIENGAPPCNFADDCPRLRSNRLDSSRLVTDLTMLRFGRSDHEIMNIFPIGRAGMRQFDPNEPGARPNRSSLRILSVTGYRNITDRSLHHLASSAPHLRVLDLSETNVTDTGVELFKVMQPDCEVKYSKFK